MLNVAIVGCGRMGHCHALRLNNDHRSRVVALYDIDRQQAERLQHEIANDATIYDDWDQLLSHPKVDAAILCTPTSSHYQQILDCRELGWHLLCEKPLANSRSEIVELCQQASSTGPVLSVGYQRRHWSLYRFLKDELATGQWGDVQAIMSVNCERWQQTISGTWRDDPQINPGGYIGDAGSHKIDVIFYLTGLVPFQLFAQTSLAGSQVEVIATVAARLVDPKQRFRSDPPTVPVSMQFVGNAESFVENLYIHCEKASIYIHDQQLWLAQNDVCEQLSVDQSQMGPMSTANPISGFLDQVVDAGPELAPPKCALPVLDFTQAIRMSAQLHQEVIFDQDV